MNPLMLTVLRSALPYAVAALIGASCAWYIQGLRITAAQQDLIAHKQAAAAAAMEEKERTDVVSEQVSNDWAANLVALRDSYARRVLPRSTGKAPGVSASPDAVDVATTDAGTGAGGIAPPLTQRCAETTMQLLFLQSWVREVGDDH